MNKKGLALNKVKGFTLIEIIVVIAVIALVIPSIFAILFGIVREQTKIYRLSTVKREGDYALNVVNGTIRNSALSIHSANPPSDANEKCKIVESFQSTNDRLFFKDELGGWFRILFSAEKISSYSGATTVSVNLNSDKTVVSNFTIGCTRSAAYSPAIVSLSFDICYAVTSGDCASSRPEETATMHYQTKIKLRNY